MSNNSVLHYEKNIGHGTWLFYTPPPEEISVRLDDPFGEERDVAGLLDPLSAPTQLDNLVAERTQSLLTEKGTHQKATDTKTLPYTESPHWRDLDEVPHESQDLWILRSDWLELGSGVQSESTVRADGDQYHDIIMARAGESLTSFTDPSKCGSGLALTHSSGGQVNKTHFAALTSAQLREQPILSLERAGDRSSVLIAHLTGYPSSEDEDINVESEPRNIHPRSPPAQTRKQSHQQLAPVKPGSTKSSSDNLRSAHVVRSDSGNEADTVAKHPTATASRTTIASRNNPAQSHEGGGGSSLLASTSTRLKPNISHNGPRSTRKFYRPVNSKMKRQPTSSNAPLATPKRPKTRGGFVDDSDDSDDGGSKSGKRSDSSLLQSVKLKGQREAEDGRERDDWDSVPASPLPPQRLPLGSRTIASSPVPLPAKGVNVSRLRMLLGRKEQIPVAKRNSLSNTLRSHVTTHPNGGLKSTPVPAVKFPQPLTKTLSSIQSTPPLAQHETIKQPSFHSNARILSGGSLLGAKKSTASTPQSSPAQANARDTASATAPSSNRHTEDLIEPSQGTEPPGKARISNAAKVSTLQIPQKKPCQVSDRKQGPLGSIGRNDRQTSATKGHYLSVTKVPSNVGVVNDLIHSIRQNDEQLLNKDSHTSATTRKTTGSHSTQRTQKRKAEGITGEPQGNVASVKKTRTLQPQLLSGSSTFEAQAKPMDEASFDEAFQMSISPTSLESSTIQLTPTTAINGAQSVLKKTVLEATSACVPNFIDLTPQDMVQSSNLPAEPMVPAKLIQKKLPSTVNKRSVPQGVSEGTISAPIEANSVLALQPSGQPSIDSQKVDQILDHEATSTSIIAIATPSSAPSLAPTASLTSPISSVHDTARNSQEPTQPSITVPSEAIAVLVARQGESSDRSANDAAPLAPTWKPSLKEVFQQEKPPSSSSTSERDQGTEFIDREDADAITLSISTTPNQDAEPYFEYSVFQKIWSDEQEEEDVAATEMAPRPFTCVSEANAQAEKLFNSTREQFQQHSQVRFDESKNKRDDHDCSILVGVFAPISYASKKSHIKIWVQRDYVSALANQNSRSLKLTSFVSKTIYVLRLFKVIEPIPESDAEGSSETIRTVRVYHAVPCAEAYTTLEAANRAALGLEVELSHEKKPKECMRAWYEKELRKMNTKLNELTEHASKEVEEGCWESKFNGCGLFKGDKFELMVEKVRLCGPRNL
jgi:hypothetical protein